MYKERKLRVAVIYKKSNIFFSGHHFDMSLYYFILEALKRNNGINVTYFPTENNFDATILKNKFDVILNMEVIEHVSDVSMFIENCSKLIKKNGIMFVATINKNLKSYVFAIVGAEYILRWLPIGTHDWDKFLTPKELENIAKKKNFILDGTVGMKFNFFLKKWKKSSDFSVNYISTFLKN